ncbi:MAG: hypothetical protein LQ349_001105 [Xanthoria aureola]|nr:MAG: hypothetical protein LQ349_001105 [Xanthoria aureola]
MASEQAKTLAAYRRRMQSAVFFLMEERACRLATEQCKYFIRAGEFGVCDGAIVIRGGPLDAGRGDAETIFSDNGAAFVMAGVDIKTIMMRCDNIRGAILSYSVTRNQLESCTALILCNPAEPDFVIFLPFYYVPGLTTWEETREANEKKETIVSMPPFRPEWSLHPAPPFPSEINPYTGVSLNVPTTGKLSNRSILESASPQKINALKQVEVMYEAFRDCSERFRVELVGLRPLLGDLKLIERATGLELIVELKDGMCELPRQGENGAKVLRHSQTQLSNNTVFNWTRQWDFLFTTVDSAVAFLIPRDRIPKDWWNSQHRVVETSDDFGEYRIDTRSPRRTVHDIERVLDLAKETTNSMAAREKIPFGSCPWKTMEQPDDEELPGDDGTADDGADLLLPERWSTIAYTKGFGSYQQSHDMRGNTYAFWQSELLWEKCRIG